MEDIVHLTREAEALEESWSPRVVGRVNDQYVKVARLEGEFTWHSHAEEDELFLVLRGELKIQYEDRETVHLSAGEMHVVPRGVRHNPVAEKPCWVALVEPVGTLHTGDTPDPRARSIEEQLSGKKNPSP